MKRWLKILLILFGIIIALAIGFGVLVYHNIDKIASGIGKEMKKEWEKSQVKPVKGNFELFGRLTTEDVLWEAQGEAGYRPLLVLEVQHVFQRNESVKTEKSPAQALKAYTRLEWTTIYEGYQGIYGLTDTLKKYIGRPIRIIGKIYDRCGEGWYLRGLDSPDISCSSFFQIGGFEHIKLKNISNKDLKIRK